MIPLKIYHWTVAILISAAAGVGLAFLLIWIMSYGAIAALPLPPLLTGFVAALIINIGDVPVDECRSRGVIAGLAAITILLIIPLITSGGILADGAYWVLIIIGWAFAFFGSLIGANIMRRVQKRKIHLMSKFDPGP